jgi:filamentous hemagglutinin
VGEVKIVNGEVKYIDNTSGHYEPSGRAAQTAAEDAFSRKGLDVGGKYIEKSGCQILAIPEKAPGCRNE